MEKTEILARVDHTALKSTATWEDIRLLCEEAVEYKTASRQGHCLLHRMDYSA